MKSTGSLASMALILSLILSNSADATEQGNPSVVSTTSTNANQSPKATAATATASSSVASNSQASGQPRPAHHASFPKVILGVITGIVVGTPVCAVRQTMDQDKFATTDMTGGNTTNKKNELTAATGWSPFAAMAGVLESPFWAVNNSLVNYDRPFSKEQMSLHQRTGSYTKELQSEDKNQAQTQIQSPSHDGNQPQAQDK